MAGPNLEGTRFEGAFDWAGHTSVHPIGLAALVLLGGATIVVPRRYALLPIVLMACLVTSGQRIAIAGLNFDFLRIMVLCGFARLLINNEFAGFIWKPLDTIMILWAGCGTLIYTMHYGEGWALQYKLGQSFDSIGMYFMFRCLLRNWADFEQLVRNFTLVSIPVALAFLLEASTGRNVFSVFGYVPAETLVREGKLRCQGPFGHPILAGCFWASLMPLMAARWWSGPRERRWAVVGIGTSALIVFLCASSTPVMALIFGLLAAFFFPLRRHMRLVRWSFLALVIGLHMVMKAPVWHLISRIDISGGSTGYHRYSLINGAIENFSEWCFTGVSSTAHWGWGLEDVTNQFVLEGVEGGAATLLLFVLIVAFAFRGVGRIWRSVARDPRRIAMAWAIGVSLFVHCTNFIGVSYFSQIRMLWFLILAIVCSMESAPSATQPKRAMRVAVARRVRSRPAMRIGEAPP